MRPHAVTTIAWAACAALAGAVAVAEDGWHKSLDEGLDAARKSGRPLLVVTGWPRGT